MTERAPILLAAAPSYDQAVCDAAVERLFAALPAAGRISAQSRVLLKPNLLARRPPDAAVTTHPAVVRAVIRACKARGVPPGHITVADSPGGIYNPAVLQALYRTTGMAQVCAEEGVLLYTACESRTVPCPQGRVVREFALLQPVCQADVIIDLPKLKTHVMTGMTAACKNLFGCIPGLKKTEWHTRFPDKERFGDMLIDLLGTVKPAFAIVDAVVGMEGDGPGGGTPRPAGLLLAGQDLPLLDLCCAGLLGLAPARVPYLAAAQARGLCPAAFDPACLAGDTALYGAADPWQLPSSYQGGGAGDTDFAHTGRVPGPLRPLAQWAEGKVAPHPVIDRSRCVGCGKCAEICPQHTITLQNGVSHIHAKACIRCFCCHEVCPVKAIAVKQLRLFGW